MSRTLEMTDAKEMSTKKPGRKARQKSTNGTMDSNTHTLPLNDEEPIVRVTRRRSTRKVVTEPTVTVQNNNYEEIIHSIAHPTTTDDDTNEMYDYINHEGHVPDLPTVEQIRKSVVKYMNIYKEFCVNNKILPMFYLTPLTLVLLLLLFIVAPRGSNDLETITEFYKPKSIINNKTNEFSIDEVLDSKNIAVLIKAFNVNMIKMSEQIKKYQTSDEINHMTRQIIQENIQIYEKIHETKYNNEKAATNQKLALMNKKLENLESEIQKIGNYFKEHDKIDSQNEIPRVNFELQNEIANLKQYCSDSTKFQEFSFQKLQKKLLHDLKFWIENNFISKSELVKYLNKHNETKFSIWNYFSFKNGAADKTVDSKDFDRIKDFIKQAIYIYNADKTGMVDFALESAGASIITSRCSESYNKNLPEAKLFGWIRIPYYHNSPRLAIQPQVLPGECWAFSGTKGSLVIRLSARITPTSVSIEHIPLVLVPNGKIDSAIRNFSVFGYKDEKMKNGILLGSYQFEADSPEYLQYFPIHSEVANIQIQVVEFKVESNYGNKNYTCIYRVRVHGILAE